MPRRVLQTNVMIVIGLALVMLLLIHWDKSGKTKYATPGFDLPSSIGAASEGVFLINRVPELPEFLRNTKNKDLITKLYSVEEKVGRLSVPDTFHDKVKEMFKAYPGGSDSLHFVESQTLVTIYNRYTHDHTLFNTIRRYRPGYREKLTDEEDRVLRKLIDDGRGDNCDFCNPGRTASDIFGKIEGTHCYIAANVAKYEKWHSLLISKEHDPLKFDLAAISDYLQTASKYFSKVHSVDPSAVAPHLMWDSTGRASASQMHQHMQMSISTHYYTKAQILRDQSMEYSNQFGRSLFVDMASVHHQLGLLIRRGDAVLMSHLTPVKERELIVVGSTKSKEFAELLYLALRGLIDVAGTRSFSCAIVFESLDNMDNTPGLARCIDRGAPQDVRNDVGAMEFYGSNNVGQDPFELMAKIREAQKILNL
eukprot:TRINITY_DN1405_c1_g1_i1.p1 TRINITY_DN1405_c1_g1~~TRINITY_DN1405_c1_g1_i1.p1  ORF type:complete len:423 (+),score=39.47 TRINITY_DN1405_c1_g1_i1:85-1353(+)